MSCEYCNKWNRKPIVSGWGGRVELDGSKIAMYLRGHGGSSSKDAESRVRFCPMCGRKLPIDVEVSE